MRLGQRGFCLSHQGRHRSASPTSRTTAPCFRGADEIGSPHETPSLPHPLHPPPRAAGIRWWVCNKKHGGSEMKKIVFILSVFLCCSGFGFVSGGAPIATDARAGKVKPGRGLSVASDGTLTVTATFPYVSAINTDATIGSTNSVVVVSGNTIITLPTAVGAVGKQYIIIKADSSATQTTVITTSSQTINGMLTVYLNTQYEVLRVLSDNSNWLIY